MQRESLLVGTWSLKFSISPTRSHIHKLAKNTHQATPSRWSWHYLPIRSHTIGQCWDDSTSSIHRLPSLTPGNASIYERFSWPLSPPRIQLHRLYIASPPFLFFHTILSLDGLNLRPRATCLSSPVTIPSLH